MFLLPLLAFAALSHAATYYVAPTGDDTAGDGSMQRPWRTVQHAVDRAQPGDTITLRQGRYHEGVRISKSGLPDAPITITAHAGEEVILDGTISLTDWQPATRDDPGLTVHGVTNPHWQHIRKARVPAEVLPKDKAKWRLIENGQYSRIARWPDQSVGYGTETAEFQPVPEEAFGGNKLLRDNIHLNPDHADGFWRPFMAGLTAEQRTTYFDHALVHVWMRYRGNFDVHRRIVGWADNAIQLDEDLRSNRPLRDGDRYSILRHPHALDSAGEFYFTPEPDSEGYHTFYLWPTDEASLAGGIVLPVHEYAFYAVHQRHITLDGLRIYGYTGNGIFFRRVVGSAPENSNDGTIIRNCIVTDCGGTGIYLQQASDSIVEHCRVERVGGRGIFVTGGQRVKVRHSEVTGSASTCISFYSVLNGQITDNRIYGARGVHANGSSVYLGSQNILVARNIYYNATNATFQNIRNVVFFANVIDGRNEATNLVATWPNTRNSDYPTQGYQLYLNNTIIRGDSRAHLISVREETENYAFNNLIGGSSTMPLFNKRSHNAWIPLHKRWEAANGSFDPRGEMEGFGPGEWNVPSQEVAQVLPRMFVDLEKLDYRLAAGDNRAIHGGRDIQSLLEEMGVKREHPDFDFSVDLAGNPWNATPSLGAYEFVPGDQRRE